MFFAPDVTTAVSTTIPSAVGDIILHTDPGIGDNLGWICTTAGTSGTWTPFGMRTAVLMGQTDATGVSAGATQYFPAQGAMTNATSANVSMPLPAAGTLRRFYAKASAAPSAGDTFTIKLVKNGSLVSPTITISDAATTASDTSTTVSVSKADTINWEVTASAGTPANTIISVGMELLVDPS
jgi:hypothetical protein